MTDNLNIGPDDFGEYCISAPSDMRLGSVSAQQLCGLYTITPEGQAAGTDNYMTLAQNFPGGENMSQVFNGIDLTFNGRFDNGVTLGGGMSTGSMGFNECFVIDTPQQVRPGYCEVSEPWSAGTQLKLNGALPLPYETQVSFVFQNLPGLPWSSAYRALADPAERAAVEAQLGRPVAVGFETIQLFPAGSGTTDSPFNRNISTTYEPRLTQLDLRFSKIFQFGQARVRGWFDIFNIFNASSASNLVASYNPDIYPRIAQVMGGAVVQGRRPVRLLEAGRRGHDMGAGPAGSALFCTSRCAQRILVRRAGSGYTAGSPAHNPGAPGSVYVRIQLPQSDHHGGRSGRPAWFADRRIGGAGSGRAVIPA